MSALEAALARHGLLALLLLSIVEGDVTILVAGVVAHLGLLPLPGVILVGAAGNFIGDSVWFVLGRRLRVGIRRSRAFQAMGPRVERVAARLGPWQLLAARVIWGTRNASMVFWGQHGLPIARFTVIDAVGCLLSATGFGLLGYGVGHGVGGLIGEVRRVEIWLLLGVIAAGLIVWGISRLFRTRLES